MKPYIFPLLLIFASSTLKAATDLIFKDPATYLHFRINLQTKDLSKELKNGQWLRQGKLQYSNIDLRDFKILANQTFQEKDKKTILISIEGTGQLFRLDVKGLAFSRIDSTYFRGHNFSSIKFIRKDTLYSLGGSGFWHINNVETFFSAKSHEWEIVHAPVMEGPQQILKQFGGYDPVRDVVSVIESPPFYHKSIKEYKYNYFEKDLKSNEWKLLGEINTELLFKLGLKTLQAEYLNGIYLFKSGDNIIIGDPAKNKIYSIDKNITLVSPAYELSEIKGFLHSYFVENQFNNSEIKADSISFNTLKSMGVVKGEFYVRKQPEINWIQLGGYLLAAALLIYLYLKKKKKPITNLFLEGLPESSVEFLQKFLNYPMGEEFDSNQITDFMGFSTYSFETQRQLRSKLIKTTNAYFSIYHKMPDVIQRKTAKEDKRFSVYSISEEHYEQLKELMGSVSAK